MPLERTWLCTGARGAARPAAAAFALAAHALAISAVAGLAATVELARPAGPVGMFLVAQAPRPAALTAPPSAVPQPRRGEVRAKASREAGKPRSSAPGPGPAFTPEPSQAIGSSTPVSVDDSGGLASRLPEAPAAAAPQGVATITAVRFRRPPQPEYPPHSRRMAEQGLVLVRVLIDERGEVLAARLEQASPFPRLNEAALKAAREALYEPHLESDLARRAWALVPIRFALKS
jgi:protein TonB